MASIFETAPTEPPGSRSRRWCANMAGQLEMALTELQGSRSRHPQNPCPESTCVATLPINHLLSMGRDKSHPPLTSACR